VKFDSKCFMMSCSAVGLSGNENNETALRLLEVFI